MTSTFHCEKRACKNGSQLALSLNYVYNVDDMSSKNNHSCLYDTALILNNTIRALLGAVEEPKM